MYENLAELTRAVKSLPITYLVSNISKVPDCLILLGTKAHIHGAE